MSERPSSAFISYSHEDSKFAMRLAQDLKDAGATVWIDQLDIKPGYSWDNAIEGALTDAREMLVVLSPTSSKSPNVRDEIDFAFRTGKIIIPILYIDCVIPLRLGRTEYIDFRTDYAHGLGHLLDLLDVTQPDRSVRETAEVSAPSEAQREEQEAGWREAVEWEKEHAAQEARQREEKERPLVEAQRFGPEHQEIEQIQNRSSNGKELEPNKVKITKSLALPITPEPNDSRAVTGFLILVGLALTNVPTYFIGKYLSSLASRDPIGNYITLGLHRGHSPPPDAYRIVGISILIFGIGGILGRIVKKICEAGEWDVRYISWTMCPGFLVGFRFFNDLPIEIQPSVGFAIVGICVYLAAALEGSWDL